MAKQREKKMKPVIRWAEKEKEYIAELDRAFLMVQAAYKRGRQDQRVDTARIYQPGMLSIHFEVRNDSGDNVDQMRILLSKEQILTGYAVCLLEMEKAFANICTKSPIIRNWVVKSSRLKSSRLNK